MLFFKVAPGQPFSSSGQGMKSISAKASRIASSLSGASARQEAHAQWPMCYWGIGHRDSLSKSMR